MYGVNAMSENSLRTILVVDDEPKVRRLVVRALAGAGYAVQEARNGVEGVALFEMHKDAIGLAILDLVMPGHGGLDVANELTAIRPDLRILYISGYADSVVAHSIRREAPSLMIGKPFSPNTLVERVRELLALGDTQTPAMGHP